MYVCMYAFTCKQTSSSAELIIEGDNQSIKKSHQYAAHNDGYVDTNRPSSSNECSSVVDQAEEDPWDIVDQEDTQAKWSGK